MSEQKTISIFDLFKEVRTADLKDDAGRACQIGLKTLDYADNLKAIEAMDQARLDARRKFETLNLRALAVENLEGKSKDEFIEQILSLERPYAEDISDLAPGADDEGKEKSAVERWREKRSKDLDGMDEEVLRAMLVDRQIRTAVEIEAAQKFIDETLVRMVVDPATLEPLFSNDPTAPNFLGRLASQTRAQLLEHRQKLYAMAGEKQIRKVAADPVFLSSGESPSGPDGSPGETTVTSPTSPIMSSPSTQKGDGSTA